MFKLIIFVLVSCISSYTVFSMPFVGNNVEVKENIKVEQPIMHINIPSINVSRDIYDKNSELNDIDKNVIIMKESDYPDSNGGIVIIGAHSGSGSIAYFNDLNKVKENDLVYLKYKNKDYTYKVVKYYLDSKDGNISISNVNNKNKLFLYTCNPHDKTHYLVVVCEML